LRPGVPDKHVGRSLGWLPTNSHIIFRSFSNIMRLQHHVFIFLLVLMPLAQCQLAYEDYIKDSGKEVILPAFNQVESSPSVSAGESSTVPEPAPISFSGVGQEASQKFTLTEGLSIFTMKHSGASNFAIWLMDSNGQNVDLLVNVIGDFDGAKAVGISKPGDYLLDISADGPWTIDISQPRPQTAQSVPFSFRGRGQQVSQFITLSLGLTRFEMKHDGESNFAVWLLDSNGQRMDLLVNEIGAFDGSKAIGTKYHGIYCLDISADGNWRIDVSQ
jgi:hypothetical protein